MTPRYAWTPASEPPDSARPVQVWCKRSNSSTWGDAYFSDRRKKFVLSDFFDSEWTVTHWRDVEKPGEGE